MSIPSIDPKILEHFVSFLYFYDKQIFHCFGRANRIQIILDISRGDSISTSVPSQFEQIKGVFPVDFDEAGVKERGLTKQRILKIVVGISRGINLNAKYKFIFLAGLKIGRRCSAGDFFDRFAKGIEF